jgi:hypothetical protein
MSALPPKADMARHDRDVRFVPKADIGCVGQATLDDERKTSPRLPNVPCLIWKT